ncbi:MAG: hypothetical protein A3K19_01355 [Lentisphaerae bacterium RIFOXYB12_FULL_65_16]|nr:MAG: hypothetical protein A3K18_06235 [Lentisphaerae bacterium RIFOXYA12_64_32]OGV92544.1 MAG: hypothetical protein A3K19_01355 [Lentisphaerae bacterium RIFOXYB12_FULL_65_16]
MGLLQRKVTPDFAGLRKVIRREGTPGRVFFMEFYQDEEIKVAVEQRFSLAVAPSGADGPRRLRREIAIQSFLGYDMIQVTEVLPAFNLAIASEEARTAVSSDPVASGPIQTWQDFEKYPWPQVSKIDTGPLEWLEKNLSENMRCYSSVPVGYYKMLLGFESMCYLIYDQPDLVAAVLTRVREIFVDYCRLLGQFRCVAAMWGADDMGFKTQTFLPPEFLRKNVLPVHRACADAAHAAGKFYFLHSCGNLREIMPDIIHDVKIDAKHSFEDAILPIEEAKRLYGHEVALLGGLDVDFLCRADERGIRQRVRSILDACHSGGGYCLGSGNSVAKYVPLENYLIMLDEGRNYGMS